MTDAIQWSQSPALPAALAALYLIPLLPMLAAAAIAFLKQKRRKTASTLAIGAMSISMLLALMNFVLVVAHPGFTLHTSTEWIDMGGLTVELGLLLDPLAAGMALMVTFVGLLIFIYSTGYMEHDKNYTRFFCFLSLFAGAMLGVVLANSILLLFMCWELVGLTSYLLIGFWYEKPSAAAAAKKAFLTTRVGDVFFLLGIVWLFAQTGTLAFYRGGTGALEPAALQHLVAQPALFGLTAATAIGLLIFAGAAGKSGQLPLHVWLPDAMEGPTPVSALIHAATMVAAGVYLVARVYPLMSAGMSAHGTTIALSVITWVGAATALFAALIAVAQNDIKRILAYSTVSQLGYMMAGLGLGGVAVGMFHLITHAFFKALLFMGAGSVIHGSHEEQDIRHMGGLRTQMRVTFATYAIGMLALCGFPLFFSGFWSKDAILDAAQHGPLGKAPFYMLATGALLTAFYMTRQVCYVFFGTSRAHHAAHESPRVMTAPLAILAFFAIALGAIGTPAWPWFHAFLEGKTGELALHWDELIEPGLMGLSALIVFAGIGLGWLLYGNKPPRASGQDALETAFPLFWKWAANRFYVDELYGVTVIAFYYGWGRVADLLDRFVWGGAVWLFTVLFQLWARLNRFLDQGVVDGSFDKGCETLSTSGGLLARVQSGRVQAYLRILAGAVVALAFILFWSSRA